MKYRGVIGEQLPGSPEIVLFQAPAADIAAWSGIPQRRRVATSDGAVETAGFQREEKATRVADLATFMHDNRNVIQNPLLAATQDDGAISIDRHDDGTCDITINIPDLDSLSLEDLFLRILGGLEGRMPSLSERQPAPTVLQTLRKSLSVHVAPESATSAAQSEPEESNDNEDSVNATAVLFEEETQVVDFYDELKARFVILKELGASANQLESIGGFGRDFLESLVKPVVLVDGQHRLRGALKAIEEAADTDDGTQRIAELVDGGMSAAEAEWAYAREAGRVLPVSLLLDASPAEHVFQFVVVNQRATPMSPALLGTIVSTSLSQDELDPIRQRLRQAGIELESSRAIAYLSRAPESPFRGLVATGMGGDRPNALPWSVLGKLSEIFRHLQGGAPYHPPLIDSAKIWRDKLLPASGLIEESVQGEDRLKAWSAQDGPWRELFIRVFTRIRDKFGSMTDPNAGNYWGSTKSNLYNMVSLSILAADFFAFLRENNYALKDWAEVESVIDQWIGDLSSNYFARDWRMGGTKKDQPLIKKAWSEAWAEYRITRDRLPRIERYNPGSAKGA